MAVVWVGSVRGAPGATTLAVALASLWPRRAVVVEADPDGGVLAVRHGLSREPGLAALAAATREVPSAAALARCAQSLPGSDVEVVMGPEAGDIATRIVEDVADRLTGWLRAVPDADVIVDGGRFGPRSPASAAVRDADDVVLVGRPRADELYALASRAPALRSRRGAAGVVLVGDRPYSAGDVGDQLALRIVGVVADDARAARALGGEGVNLGVRRSSLVRSVAALASRLAAELVPDASPPLAVAGGYR